MISLKIHCIFGQMSLYGSIWNIYSTIERSIADIYDQGIIFTKARCAEVNMFAEVRYRGYGPTYRATYNILYGECTTGEPF